MGEARDFKAQGTVWLVMAPFDLPLRGLVTLWTIAIVVLAVGIIELFAKSWRY